MRVDRFFKVLNNEGIKISTHDCCSSSAVQFCNLHFQSSHMGQGDMSTVPLFAIKLKTQHCNVIKLLCPGHETVDAVHDI